MASDMVSVRRPPYNQYAQEPQANIGRSQFNRSHGLKTTFDASMLVPILVDEVLPGDTFTMKLNGFARIFSPLDAPIMDNIELETFFFFVPNRLVWARWEHFNGASDDAGEQVVDYTIPILGSGVVVNHGGTGLSPTRLMGYMGLPNGLNTSDVEVNALPFRCYTLIYEEWFRDQNLIDKVSGFSTGNGPDTIPNIYVSAKKHDYFTSCLPFLQKGSEQTIGIGGTAPVLGIGVTDQTPGISGGTFYESNQASQTYIDAWVGAEVGVEAGAGSYPAIYADLTNASGGVSINALRQSVAIQRLLERDARGGTRYVEMIKAHFGVTSPDFRHQRPEFLGGGKSFINISPVSNTSATATEAQGELKGIGTGQINGHGWAKSFTEHGYVIGIVRARGDITYFQGLDRMWSRSGRYDFYIPALANLGEQAVYNKEIYVSNVPGTDEAVFGYQERWAEYRQKKSMITGKLNPDVSGSLSHWHLAEDFGSLPALNQTFIEDATPMDRVTTIDDQPDFLLDLWFDYKCARPIPIHSVPSLMPMRF